MATQAEIYAKIKDLLARREPFAVASVIKVRGSASAKPGSKAVIDAKGKNLLGWVGGGCAESYVGSQAIEALAVGCPRIIEVNLDDEIFGLGMPCGGYMDVYIEPHLPQAALAVPITAQTKAATQHLVENLGFQFAEQKKSNLEPSQPALAVLEEVVWLVYQALKTTRGGTGCSLRNKKTAAATINNKANHWPPTELLILGSSRITEELARLGILLKWPVRLYASAFNRENYPDAVKFVTTEAGYRNLHILEGAAVVVASHHKGDPDFIKTALAAKSGYIGLVASQKRAHLVLQDLLEQGESAAALRTVYAPAGLDCGCLTPQDIALSVVAEILSIRPLHRGTNL